MTAKLNVIDIGLKYADLFMPLELGKFFKRYFAP